MSRPVVGLDPSLTGLGLVTPDGAWTLSSRPGDRSISDQVERLVGLVDTVGKKLPPHSLVVIEGPAYSRQLGAGHHLGAGLWWALCIELTWRGHELVEVPPTTLKKFATGRGNATKADMRVALLQRAGIDERDDNRVDATWLRYAGLHAIAGGAGAPDLPKTHTEALAKVQWPTEGDPT